MIGHLGITLLGVLALVVPALVLFTAVTVRWAERAVPPSGSFVDLGGAKIHYADRGSGPPVVLIHGLSGTGRNFTHSLSEHLERDFRVLVVDRPGAGHSTRRQSSPPGPLGDADVVASFIRTLGLERPILVGHSLGGAVALATAIRHPELIGALALVAPLTHPQDTPPTVFRGLTLVSGPFRHVLAWTLATPITVLVRPMALKVIFAPEPVPPDFGTAGGGYLALRPEQLVGASADLLALTEDLPWLLDRYRSLRLPVGILHGTGDRILDPLVHSRGMADQLPHLQLELVAGGHMLPLTQPERVAEFVRKVAQGEQPPTHRAAGDRPAG